MSEAFHAAEALRAASALFEANGMKFETADLTYMDGDDWPKVAEGEFVIGEMLPSELNLMKVMVESGKMRDKLRKKIVGIAMRKSGERMERGEDAPELSPGSGLSGILMAVTGFHPDDIPGDLLQEQCKYDETMDLVNSLMFYGIKSRLKRHGDGSVGVRRGGKVVSTRKEMKA